MALALRLFLLLLLAVALTARAAQAAPWRAKEADEHARKPPPAPWLHEDLLPREPTAGVSAGKTLQGPLLVALGKHSSNHRGLPRGRSRVTDLFLKATNHLEGNLRNLERLREMERQTVLKEAFPGGSSGTLVASAEGREVIPNTVTGDEHARKPPPAPWLHEDLLPLEPPAGRTAGKTLQGPLLVASGKPSSHHRGLLRERNKLKDLFLKASKHLEENLSNLERRREMEGQTVLKEAFPGGSSGTLVASAEGKEVMPNTVTGDEHARKPPPAPWLHEDLLPLEPPAGVSAGKRLQDALLIASGKPSSHHRGVLRRRNKLTDLFLKASKHLEENLRYLERLREMERQTVLKEAFPGGSSGTLVASAEGREVMPNTVTEDEHARKPPPAPWLHEDLLPLEPPAGVSAGKRLQDALLTASGKPSSHHRGLPKRRYKSTGRIKSQDASKHLDQIRSYLELHHDAVGVSRHDKIMWKRMRSVFCWGRHCLLKLMAIVAGGALLLMMCFAGIWYCYKRKQCSCADTEEQPKGTGSDNLPRDNSPCQSPCALAWLHPRLRCTPAPPKRAALPPSPLALLPGPG
ncbi:uncharacterized protein LOC130249052 [Oenanthe melanoleuca]|uniref:uncharacterized protein LOC130249052 n=1 Tax=Oenanthe melanoleuca TaxID=2939378 RepID=UPI0024C15E5B|nr:uncharacterized protein LOC130249052 [Oenanthe melanoleuca]